MKPVVITFKDGALLTGIGKKKGSTFKYKSDNNAKAEEFEFSKIESVKMENYNDKDIIYKFFQVEGDERFIAVEELVSGTKAELFTTSSTFNHGGMGMNDLKSNLSKQIIFCKLSYNRKIMSLRKHTRTYDVRTGRDLSLRNTNKKMLQYCIITAKKKHFFIRYTHLILC
jgi:hypothetical protein